MIDVITNKKGQSYFINMNKISYIMVEGETVRICFKDSFGYNEITGVENAYNKVLSIMRYTNSTLQNK